MSEDSSPLPAARRGRAASALAALGSAAVVALVGVALLGTQLHAILIEGWAHSFDAAIYARSLWGVAAGNFWNPVVDLHVMSIHFNLVLFVLAPFVAIASPLLVLIGAQSAAFGVTLAAAGLAAGRGATPVKAAACAGGAAALLLASPVVANPFLFDVRPDLIGVPWLVVCLLLAHRRGRWTPALVFGMLPALFIREELFLVIVGALSLSPFGPFRRDDMALRAGGAAAAVGIWAGYWYGVRRWLADGSFDRAHQVAAEFLDASTVTAAAAFGYRAELVAIVVLAGGGLALVGWRWLGPAVPGLLFLVGVTRMGELVAQLHYVLFVVPGAVVAVVDGVHRLRDRRWPVWGAVVALALVLFLTSSALVGGGRFRAQNALPASSEEHEETRRRVRQLHKLASRVPPDAGLVLPWGVAAPVADRAWIRVVERVDTAPGWDALTCEDASAVLVPFRALGSRGVELRERGWHLRGFVDRGAAWMDCEPGRLPWEHLGRVEGGARCERPLWRWPEANLEACEVVSLDDGAVGLRLQAIEPGRGPEHVRVTLGDIASGRGPEAFGFRGLVPAGAVAEGRVPASFAVRTLRRVPDEWFVAVEADGRLVTPEAWTESGWSTDMGGPRGLRPVDAPR